MSMDRAHRLLIVDDEEPLLASLSQAAAAFGCHVETAADGEQAWKRLEEGGFDLVVTDLKMPGMDGTELLARLEREGRGTRVVVITGYATLEAAVECLRKGAMDFLVKPFEVDTFLSSVQRALARPAPLGTTEPDWDALAQHYRLTRRQVAVLRALYRTGKTNSQLAAELQISPHTVKSHLKAAFAKLGVSSRAELLQKLRTAA
ncbi:MAG: response regulator [Deferrisomatales bacterium]